MAGKFSLSKFLRCIVIVAVFTNNYFSTCSGQHTPQDAAPNGLPNIAGSSPKHPNEPASKQDGLDAIDETTPKPRGHRPYEKNTTTLIRLSNQTMDTLEIYLDKYDTQLNLNTLDNLIPILKQIRTNLTNLLSHTTSLGRIKFQQEKLVLDKEISQVESHIGENRELLNRYEVIHRATKEQLGTVYKNLGAILKSQVYILSLKYNDNLENWSAEDIEHWMNRQLTSHRYYSDILTTIHSFLQKLSNPSNRLVGYSYFMSQVNFSTITYADEVGVQIAREIFTFPELEELRESLPPLLTLLFTDEPKSMKLKWNEPWGKILTVGDTGSPSLVAVMADDVKRWKFHPIGGGSKFFAIVDTKTNQALGNTDSYGFEMLRFDDTIQFKEKYHWTILTKGGDSDYMSEHIDVYLCFINRATGLIMGSTTGLLMAGSNEYIKRKFGSNQWELE